MKKFLEDSHTALFSLDVLEIYSHTIIVQSSQSLTFRQCSIYIRERQLKRGSFERVDKVVDVSIDTIYARKKFYESQWEKNEKHKRQQKEDWLNQIRREIRIMRENMHVSIIILFNWMKFDRLKEKHCSDCEFSRKSSVIYDDVISLSRKFEEFAQKKFYFCERNCKSSCSSSQRTKIPAFTRRSTSRFEIEEYSLLNLDLLWVLSLLISISRMISSTWKLFVTLSDTLRLRFT